jgi:hypothetical protein
MAEFYPDGSSSSRSFYVGNGSSVTAAVHVHPLYNGSVINDYDLALVQMGVGSFGAGVESYSFYTGSTYTSDPFVFVGYGKTGSGSTGTTGDAGFDLSNRHQGWNTFDVLYGSSVLMADFDNGLAANDASCSVFGVCNLGLGNLEAITASGDSGGPVFIAPGVIGAVTSFGLRTGSPPDIDGTLNSSFGELAGFVALGPNSGFLQLAVPEPGSYALAGLGLAALLLFRRRFNAPVAARRPAPLSPR